MRVSIYGPNLPTRGPTFHVHRTGCADTMRGIYPRLSADQTGWATEATHPQDVVEEVYAEMIEESEGTWSDYVSEFKFFPCCFSELGEHFSTEQEA